MEARQRHYQAAEHDDVQPSLEQRHALAFGALASLSAFAAAATSFGVFWARGIASLYTRHPHEDAFILFRYAENLGRGLGIVFNANGTPTEGATDFLWMVALAGLSRLGMDAAVAAVFLNALGTALTAWILVRVLTHRSPMPAVAHAVAWFIALCLPWVGAAHASYEGFSAQLYSALCVSCFYIYLNGSRRAIFSLPYIALLLGLFRPDGVIIGACFCALATWDCFRNRAWLRGFMGHASAAAICGAGYFAWRYWYFGELLPLPLYVKSRGPASLLGISFNRDWLKSATGPGPVLLAAVAQLVLLASCRAVRGPARRIIAALVPGAVLFVALGFAHQSQNVDFRFQSPIFALCLASSLALGAEVCSNVRRAELRAFGIMIAGGALVPAVLAGKTVLWSVDYLDNFAVRTAPALEHATVALTEAGRMAYWNTASVHDLVGLNEARSARQPPTAAYVQSLSPDVVMFHQAGILDLRRATVLAGSFKHDDVVQLAPASLKRALRKDAFRDEQASRESYDRWMSPTQVAALALTRYLIEEPGFDVYAVSYYGAFRHVYGIKRASEHSATRVADCSPRSLSLLRGREVICARTLGLPGRAQSRRLVGAVCPGAATVA